MQGPATTFPARPPGSTSVITTRTRTGEGREGPDRTDVITTRRQKASKTAWAAIVREEFKPSSTRFINSSASRSIFIKFRCPAAWRLQLRSQATYLWFPQDVSIAGLGVAFEFMTRLAPQTPALTVALDASGLVQLGQEDDDERMLIAGKRLYGDALRLLRRDIATSPAYQRDGAIATVLVLQITEAFTAMEMDKASSRQHTQGLAGLLQARQPTEDSVGFQKLMDAGFYLFNLCDGLIARKRMHAQQPLNSAVLSSVAEMVPGALEDCDIVCRVTPLLRERAVQVRTSLIAIRTDLNVWAKLWNRNIKDPPYHLVPASALPFVESTASTFPLVFSFKDLGYALEHSTCTSCLFSVEQALSDLDDALVQQAIHRSQTAQGRWDQRSITTISNCADSLCMSLPYLCKSENGKYGAVISVGPLYLATAWYDSLPEDGQTARKLSWCRDAAAFIQGLGIRTL